MIPAERAHLHVAARSHPGMSGKNNEDRFAVSAYRLEGDPPIPAVLAVVADGIGGHRAGEVAAELAVETISGAIAHSSPEKPAQTLQQAVIQASQVILDQSEKDPERKGMGSTCACAWVIGDRLYTVSVGDSRIYLIRGNAIRQISTDHTWIQEAIDHGALTPEQAQGHPNAHVIRRYLGSRQQVEPDLRMRLRPGENDAQAESNQGLHLLPNDQVLLCSDGLTDLVSDDEILAALAAQEREAALDDLIQLANERGGHDNITLVSLQMPETAGQLVPAEVKKQRTRWQWGFASCAGLATFIVAGALLLGGLWWLLNRPGVEGTPTPAGSPVATLQPGIFPSIAPLPSFTPLPPATNTPPTATRRVGAPTTSPSFATITPWPTNTLSP